MTTSQESKDKQEQLAKNLGKVFKGLDSTGHKPMPKPMDEVPKQPATKVIEKNWPFKS